MMTCITMAMVCGLAVADDKPAAPEQLPSLAAMALMGKLKVGDSCAIFRTPMSVVEIVDENNAVVRFTYGGIDTPRQDFYWCCKLPTKGKTDGQDADLGDFMGCKAVTVSGTMKWKRPFGSKTVFVLEPIADKDEKPKDKAEAPDFAGVYADDNVELTLGRHPFFNNEYVGYLLNLKDNKIQPVNFSYDDIKGCNGQIFDGTRDKVKAVELKLDGRALTFRWYDGPTWTLKRRKAPDEK